MSAGKSLLRSAAADESWANTLDRPARTANGRKAFNDGFEKEAARLAAEQGVELTEEELAKRAMWLRRAHFKRLAAKSVAVRRSRSLKSRIPVDGNMTNLVDEEGRLGEPKRPLDQLPSPVQSKELGSNANE